MKNVNKVVLSIASVIALSQSAMANESANLVNEAKANLNIILANNIAEIEGTRAAGSADDTFAKLGTQLQTNMLVAEAVKSLPKAPKFKVVIAD